MKVCNKLQRATGLLLLAILGGCRHAAPPPPLPAAPAITSSTKPITVITPLPSVPLERKADVRPAAIEQPAPAPAPAPAIPVTRVHHLRRKVASAPPVNTASETPAQTEARHAGASGASTLPRVLTPAISPPSPSSNSSAAEAASKLGELSTGTTINGSARTKVLGQIQLQELRLSRLKEVATSEITSVQTQVRSFLAKARQAVTENDLDGAQTLNTKARVLLDELAGE